MDGWLMTLIFAPMLIGALIFLVDRRLVNRSVHILQAGLFGVLVWVSILYAQSGSYSFVMGGWQRGIGIPLRLDHWSLVFLWMTWVGICGTLYFNWTIRKIDHKVLFLVCFLEGVLMSTFLLYDWFSMFILLELSALIISILVTYARDGASVRAGLYYLLINSVAMVIVLLGIMLLYVRFGTMDLQLIADQVRVGDSVDLVRMALGSILIGFIVKAAVVPVYGWLPIVHTAAPSEVSALLSGLLVKLGIYGMIRTLGLFPCVRLQELLWYIGAVTAVLGVVYAVFQRGIKRMLAYHTISQVGLIMLGLFSGKEVGVLGGGIHLFNHFVFKSILFFAAGMIAERFGTREMKRVHGVWACDRWLSVLLIIGVVGITGVPLFAGSVGKALIKKGLTSPFSYMVLQVVNAGTILSFLKLLAMLPGEDRSIRGALRSQYATTTAYAILMVLAVPVQLWWLRQLSLAPVLLSLESMLNFAALLGAAVIARGLIIKGVSESWQVWFHRNAPFQQEVTRMGLALAAIWFLQFCG